MSPYNELRAALAAQLEEPGFVTRDEVQALLDRFPPLPDDPPPSDNLLRLG